MASIIDFTDISKTFKVPLRAKGKFSMLKNFFARKHKTIEALKNVSFKVDEGDIVGYIGPNGAGKSTTIKNHERNTHSNIWELRDHWLYALEK